MTLYRLIVEADADVFEAMCRLNGWAITGDFAPTDQSSREVAAKTSDGVALKYTEDQFIAVRYLDVFDATDGRLIEYLASELGEIPAAEIVELAAQDQLSAQERVDWLMSLAAVSPMVPKKDVTSILRKRIKDSEAPVRMASLIAAAWLEWPALRPAVKSALKDPVEENARYAAAVLEGFDRLGQERPSR